MCDKKLVWAKWNSLVISRSWGGLGLRELELFNKALLGKWSWRALGGGEALWLDIVRGSVGRKSGTELSSVNLINPGSKQRGWWGVLASLRDRRGEWFVNSVGRKVGNGESTLFWEDLWARETKLSESFQRLYELSSDKKCSMARAGSWVENEWVWKVGCRRELRAWESEDSNKLSDLLQCRKTKLDEPDRWTWKPEKKGCYVVKSAYKILLERNLEVAGGSNKTCKAIWSSSAPPKVQAMVWRLIFGRIATKSELRRRGVIPTNCGMECSLCNGATETIEHLFFECSKVWSLWCSCLEWIGTTSSFCNKATMHFSQFCSLGDRKNGRATLEAIWMCMVWLIWNKRNDLVFNNGVWQHEKIFGEVKSYSWKWELGRRRKEGKCIRFSRWVENPFDGFGRNPSNKNETRACIRVVKFDLDGTGDFAGRFPWLERISRW